MTAMIATKTFVSPVDGSRAKGEVFHVKDERASILAKASLAKGVPDQRAEVPASLDAEVEDSQEAQERPARKSKA